MESLNNECERQQENWKREREGETEIVQDKERDKVLIRDIQKEMWKS